MLDDEMVDVESVAGEEGGSDDGAGGEDSHPPTRVIPPTTSIASTAAYSRLCSVFFIDPDTFMGFIGSFS
jgi:hypothetical protein